MELRELIQKKLADYKKSIVDTAIQSKHRKIKEWAKVWAEAEIIPPPYYGFLLPVGDNPIVKSASEKGASLKLFAALNAFRNACKKLDSGEYEASLESLFGVVSQLGSIAGIQEEQKRMVKERSGGKHLKKKQMVIQYYINNPALHSGSHPEAAEEIEQQGGTGLKYETIYRYLLQYAKISKKIEEGMAFARASISECVDEFEIDGSGFIKSTPADLENFLAELEKQTLDELISRPPDEM